MAEPGDMTDARSSVRKEKKEIASEKEKMGGGRDLGERQIGQDIRRKAEETQMERTDCGLRGRAKNNKDSGRTRMKRQS